MLQRSTWSVLAIGVSVASLAACSQGPAHLSQMPVVPPGTACAPAVPSADPATSPSGTSDSAPATRVALVPDSLKAFLASIGWCDPADASNHDEQAVVDGEGTPPSELHVIASPLLKQITDSAAFGRGWVHVAVLQANSLGVATAKKPTGRVYNHLGVRPGLNCVFVRELRGRYIAAVGPCTTRSPAPAGSLIRVMPQAVTAASTDTARLADFGEAEGGAPVLGVKCGKMWCVLSDPEND